MRYVLVLHRFSKPADMYGVHIITPVENPVLPKSFENSSPELQERVMRARTHTSTTVGLVNAEQARGMKSILSVIGPKIEPNRELWAYIFAQVVPIEWKNWELAKEQIEVFQVV